MGMGSLLISLFIAALTTAAATPLVIGLAPRIGAVDIPCDERRIHKCPIPCLGGLAIYLGTLASFSRLWSWSTQLTGIVIGGSLMLVLGIVDDIRNLTPVAKLLGQITCALAVFYFNVHIRGMMNLLPVGPRYIEFPLWLSLALSVFWIVAITNTINLIDGLDGLAAGIVCIACLSIAYTSYSNGRTETASIALSVAGATLGFLAFNFYPARIFMGDGGSMFLGFMMASISLMGDTPTKGTTLFATVIPVIILALPIFDTLFAIARRMINRRPIMQADRGHLHHRIMAMGFGQRRTVLALYCISSLMGIAGILWSSGMRIEALALFAIASCLIVIFLGIGIVDAGVEPSAVDSEKEADAEEASQ